MGKQTVINGDVTKNLTVEDGDLIVHGNVQAGVEVTVRNGGVQIDKNVGDRVIIDQKKVTSSGISASSSGSGSPVIIDSKIKGDLTITTNDDSPNSGKPVIIGGESIEGDVVINGNKVTVNGKPYTSKPAPGGISGITIKGNVGNNAIIDSGQNLRIAGVVGDNSNLAAKDSITTGNVGKNAILDAGDSIDTGCIASNPSISAGKGIKSRCR